MAYSTKQQCPRSSVQKSKSSMAFHMKLFAICVERTVDSLLLWRWHLYAWKTCVTLTKPAFRTLESHPDDVRYSLHTPLQVRNEYIQPVEAWMKKIKKINYCACKYNETCWILYYTKRRLWYFYVGKLPGHATNSACGNVGACRRTYFGTTFSTFYYVCSEVISSPNTDMYVVAQANQEEKFKFFKQ